MSEYTCFICNETYWNVNESQVIVKRVERLGGLSDMTKTTVWRGSICDKCLSKYFGLGVDA